MSSTVIPREKLSAYQRWELSSFDDGTRVSPVQSPERADPRGRQDGYEAGHREGIAAARAEAARAAAAQTAKLNGLISAVQQDVARLDAQIADSVLELAVIIARRIVGEALQVRPELLLGVVREALQLLGQARTPGRLLLHPEDAKLVREHLGEQCAAGGWNIIEDATIARGGCRLVNINGDLDATLATRWQRVLAAFGHGSDWLA